jgi:MGT family glycosyltransferase
MSLPGFCRIERTFIGFRLPIAAPQAAAANLFVTQWARTPGTHVLGYFQPSLRDSHFVANWELSPSIRVSPVADASVGGVTDHALLPSAPISETEIPLSHLLVCAVPNPGHVGPMLAAAQHLQSIGHRVTFYTADTFCDKMKSTGVRFVAMPGKANYDYRCPIALPEHTKLSTTDETLQLLIDHFAETIPDQHQGMQQILHETPVDLIVVDTMFFGAFPMLMGPKHNRPPVIGCGVNPIFLSSRDCGLYSPPADTFEGRRQILEENETVTRTYQPIGDRMDALMRTYGLPPLPHYFLDSMYLLPDTFLQFTAEAFEFPRGDLPAKIHFIGPILPSRSVEFEEPGWWAELDGSRPVVLVTQGTLANQDLNELIQPALQGLKDDNVTVIVAAGRSDTHTLDLPANARVASFIPFDRVLPRVDVLVTNGGYGAVNHAFTLGVPIVVAGETEDKKVVAARVGWAGAGINLETRYPSPEQIGKAVRTILTNQQYRDEAERLRANFAQYHALDELARIVDAMLGEDGDSSKLHPDSVYAH